MIFFTILCSALSQKTTEIDKTIYLTQGEDYKINLDQIFNEVGDNTYAFVSQSKGFVLDQSNLKLKSDQGTYAIKPTKILRLRQLVNLEDYQGEGQFGILDQHETGHRICYNSDNSITLDSCIDLEDTSNSYDFVFIDKDTIAVSKIRESDKQFGVTIYEKKEIVSEFYFTPSKVYGTVQTIIEYCYCDSKNYLLFGVLDVDSNIEFLEIQANFKIVNTNKPIDSSILPIGSSLQVITIKGSINKMILVYKYTNSQVILQLYYNKEWTSRNSLQITSFFRAVELGYGVIQQKLTQTILECEQDFYYLRSWDGAQMFKNLLIAAKKDAQVKYTLNYLIILQENELIVSNLNKLNQKSNKVEGTILGIEVDFQNDILFVFTDTKIIQYFLKPTTLAYTSNTITQGLDLVTISAEFGDTKQLANIHFQVLAGDDYSLHQTESLIKDLYCNRAFYSPNNNIPLNGISGPDIRVDAKADNQVQITSHYFDDYVIDQSGSDQSKYLYSQLISNQYNPFLFRQFEDFSFQIYDCRQNQNQYQCSSQGVVEGLTQKVSLESSQAAEQQSNFALMGFDHKEIHLYSGLSLKSIIKAQNQIIFGTMRVGTDRLFTYLVNDVVEVYNFPTGELSSKIDLKQFGQPQGAPSRNLWVNEVKSNLLIIVYGDDLLIGRLTSQFTLVQRLTIPLVQDVAILSDDTIVVLYSLQEVLKLTQYQISDGLFKVQRDLSTYGFEIIPYQLLIDYFNAKVMVQAQKEKQKVLLVYGNTELARDSLIKVIPFKENESINNVIQTQYESTILKKIQGEKENYLSIIQIEYSKQVIEINMGEIHNKFSQSLDLTYSFSNYFTPDVLKVQKHLFLEYQFYNLTASQQPDNKITYKNENQFQIPINASTFKGQVREYQIRTADQHLKLTTRFKVNKQLDAIPSESICKLVATFQRILCIKGLKATYHGYDGKLISSTSLETVSTSSLKQIVLHNDEKYALVQSDSQLMLIYISQDEIKHSMAFYTQNYKIDVSIFYKGWFVNQEQNYLRFYQFSPQANDLWNLDKKYEYFTFGLQGIQYDPQTKQIIYQTGYEELFYFECSLEGTLIDKQTTNSINLAAFLQSQKIYQLNTRITNIIVKPQQDKTYLFISTSYGNILNVTIKSITEEFKVNSLYIANGGSNVQDIQFVDDIVLIQIGSIQLLYNNTNNWELNSPYLSLEGLSASNIIGLYKNGSQIVHLFYNSQDKNFYQSTIDDQIYLTVSNLKTYKPGKIIVAAYNGYGEASIDFQTIQLRDEESSSSWIWITLGIVAVIAILGGGFYCYKRRQSVDPLLG